MTLDICGFDAAPTALIHPEALVVATLWQEARGIKEDDDVVAVAEVIWRRTKWKYQSDGTLPGTVLRPMQFSGWASYDPNRVPSCKLETTDPDVQRMARLWHIAKSGTTNYSQDAVLYHHKDMATPWPLAKFVVQRGPHRFFTDPTFRVPK